MATYNQLLPGSWQRRGIIVRRECVCVRVLESERVVDYCFSGLGVRLQPFVPRKRSRQLQQRAG